VLGFQSEMSEAGADWQVITYAGARHAFTNRDADRLGNPVLAYNARADARSWSALRTFLEEVFA
jgi:dienelactone hydrolase